MERMRVTTQTIPGNVWGLVIIASSPGLDQSLLALASPGSEILAYLVSFDT